MHAQHLYSMVPVTFAASPTANANCSAVFRPTCVDDDSTLSASSARAGCCVAGGPAASRRRASSSTCPRDSPRQHFSTLAHVHWSVSYLVNRRPLEGYAHMCRAVDSMQGAGGSRSSAEAAAAHRQGGTHTGEDARKGGDAEDQGRHALPRPPCRAETPMLSLSCDYCKRSLTRPLDSMQLHLGR